MIPTVRTATGDDAPALADLAAATFALACPPSIGPADQASFLAAHLTAARFAGYVTDPGRRVLVADDDGTLLGYTLLVLGEPADEDAAAAIAVHPTVELSKCYVLPDRHGSGTAARLVAASLDTAHDAGAAGMWLGVNRHNHRAQRFYAKQGFAVVGTKHFRVGDVVEDDYVMERPV